GDAEGDVDADAAGQRGQINALQDNVVGDDAVGVADLHGDGVLCQEVVLHRSTRAKENPAQASLGGNVAADDRALRAGVDVHVVIEHRLVGSILPAVVIEGVLFDGEILR